MELRRRFSEALERRRESGRQRRGEEEDNSTLVGDIVDTAYVVARDVHYEATHYTGWFWDVLLWPFRVVRWVIRRAVGSIFDDH